MTKQTGITLFEDTKVRIVWDDEQEKYYFSVADIVQILTDSADVKQYIKRMRSRDAELDSRWGTICTPTEMVAADGKRYKTQAADLEGIFRIIQSIPSKKAEPVKRWLAEVGAQRVDQMIDPELTFQMAVGSGKCAAHICGVMKRPGKCAPHICAVDFQPRSALRIYARSIFSRVMRSAYMRGQFSVRKCAPHICAVKLHR